MIYTLYRYAETLQTVYDEQEARKLAFDLDNKDPAYIHVKNDDGSTNGYILLDRKQDKKRHQV